VLDPAHTATFNLAAYAVLATTSLAGLAVAGRIASARGRRRPQAESIARHARRHPAQLYSAPRPSRSAVRRVDCVTAAEAFAVTHRLLRRASCSAPPRCHPRQRRRASAAVAAAHPHHHRGHAHDHQAAADRTPHWSAD